MTTETRRLRGAVAGYGFISSRGHLPALRRRGDVEIVAVADICEARREAAARDLGVRTYSTARELLAEEGTRLDFLDIATPPSSHAEMAISALEAGVHVLCEKPLATSTDEASRMLDVAADVGRVIFPVHNYRHAPVIRAVRRLLDDEVIGPIHSVTLSTFRAGHARGVSEWNPDWRRLPQFSGGGIGMDHGSHGFYLLLDWFGMAPRSVSARLANLSRGLHDSEDHFAASVEFPQGLAHVHLSWGAKIRQVRYSLHGERGAILVVDDEITVHHESGLCEKRNLKSNWSDASHVDWFDALFSEFLEAVDSRDFVGRRALEAYRCVELIERAYQSAHDSCRDMPLSSVLPWDESGGN